MSEKRDEKLPPDYEAKLESKEVGRILGVISRKRPDLYAKLKALKEASGSSYIDLIIEALDLYTEYSAFEVVDVKVLYGALKLIEILSRRVFEIMFTLLQILQTPMPIRGLEEVEGEEAKEQAKAKQKELMAKMLEPTMAMLMNVVTNMLTGMTRMYAPQSQPQPAPVFKLPQQQQFKNIKVIDAEDEKEEGEGEDSAETSTQ